MYDAFAGLISQISVFMYSYLLIVMLLGVGLYFTFRSKFVQLRLLPESIRVVGEKTGDQHSVSAFEALMVSTASRVGTGNIAGVASAIAIGGYGAVFWMWLIAIVGGATAFVESTLAQIYKKKDPEGGSYGFLLWQPRPEAMERFRRDVAARPGYFPELLERAQSASGLGLTAQPYKRPKPCPDAALAPYFSWKGDLEAIAEVPAGPALFSPALADQVGQTLESWLPVSNYFYQLTDV